MRYQERFSAKLAMLAIAVGMVSSLACREIIVIDGSKSNIFDYDKRLSYGNLSLWQKIAYVLAKFDVSIHSEETIDLRYESKASLRQYFGKERQVFFIDYRGHYPTISDMRKFPSDALINILFEPPTVFTTSYTADCYNLFSKIFTFSDALVDGKKFIKFRYPNLAPMISDLVPFEDRKLCCTFIGNKQSKYAGELYSERRKAVAFFERNHPSEFDFYGPGWNRAEFSTYKGVAENKCDVMKHYKFAFSFENTSDTPGYITEKILDCFQAGVVPIYLGSPTVTQEIPPGCFIDFRKFSSYDSLYQYLISMGEEEFNQYLENIRNFIDSEQGRLFDVDHFILSIVNGLLDLNMNIEDLHELCRP